MSNIKQVYATLKIDDGLIQVLVAEYYNTRFNILATYKSEISGINDFKIVDEDKVIEGIKLAINEVSKKVGAKLEKVILVLPPLNFNRTSLKVSIIPSDGYIKKKDIARALTNSLKAKVDDSLMVINTSIIKYTVNGISTRRLPENETCDEAYLDIDLLCADKEMTYSYVETVSKAGLEILDLCLSNYAIAKESVALENSISSNIIHLDVLNNYTYLTLLSKSKLISSEIIYEGLGKMEDLIKDNYHVPANSVARLLKYNVNYQSEYPDDAIYAYTDDNKSRAITTKDLNEFIDKPLNEYLDKIMLMCKPILEKGASFLISGEGSEMNALVSRLKELSNSEVKTYFPDCIGIRSTDLCAVYGALFVYKEKANLNDLSVNCVNIAEYDNTVDQIKVDVEGESITTKIKNLFDMYKDREA